MAAASIQKKKCWKHVLVVQMNIRLTCWVRFANAMLRQIQREYFEVTDSATQRTLDKDVLYTAELHIYLDELYTIVHNKDSQGRKGVIIVVKGTSPADVLKVLM